MDEIDPLLAKIIIPKLSKGEKKKIEILQGTIGVLAERGAEGLNYNIIGQSLGLSRSLIAHYYPNKIELLLQCVQAVVVEAQSLTIHKLKKAKNLDDILSSFLMASVETFEKKNGYSVIMFMLYQYCNIDKSVKKFHTQFREMGANRVVHAITPFISKKISEQKKHQLAYDIQSQIRGIVIENYLRPTPLSKQKIRIKGLQELNTLIKQYS